MKNRYLPETLSAATALLSAACAWGWGSPHATITQAALKTLPAWQREALGDELAPLGDLYCIIPDLVHTRKDLRPYAMTDSRPGVVYLVNLHLPATPSENYELLRTFMGKAVAALQTNNIADASRYSGILAHMLEDWGCPAHVAPGDNMFNLFKQFLPPPPSFSGTLLHSPIENGTFTLAPGDRPPCLLGTSVDEAAFHLLRRVQEATVHARGKIIPIIQALYAGDTNAVNAAQQSAAAFDVHVVADALHTVFCLGRQRFDARDQARLASVDLSAHTPLEAPDLHFPQASFFSKPYWGYPTAGQFLRYGDEAAPLLLKVTENGQTNMRTFTSGMGTGTRSTLTYLIPSNVYQRFTARVGLQAELGVSGHVMFGIFGNGQSLARLGPVSGDAPAQPVDVTLAGVTNLQLTATSASGDGTGNYAIWAEPTLLKATAPETPTPRK